jgi:hypothetical protein
MIWLALLALIRAAFAISLCKCIIKFSRIDKLTGYTAIQTAVLAPTSSMSDIRVLQI